MPATLTASGTRRDTAPSATPLLRRAARSILEWPSSEGCNQVAGQVLVPRVTIKGSRDRGKYSPGEVDYIAEAHVKYEKDGVGQGAWIPASDPFTNRTQLEFRLSKRKSTLCIVQSNTRNPSRLRTLLN